MMSISSFLAKSSHALKNLSFRRIVGQLKRKYFKVTLTAGLTTCLIASHLLYQVDKHQENNLINLQKTGNFSNNALLLSNSTDEENVREKFNFINKVVSKCAPAVVYILIKDSSKKDPKTKESPITSNGSGFIISEDGWILTNAHVILDKPQSTITIVMNNGDSYNATIEAVDSVKDIALVKITTKEKLPSLEFANNNDVTVGEWVIALGSPLSLNNSASVGIVSSINRSAEDLGLRNYSMKYIQTDASITFGNSGGPLVNLDGHVIGINNLRLTSGISFAIPVDYAKTFLNNTRLMKKFDDSNNNPKQLFFGLTTIPITSELIQDLLRSNKNIPEDINEGLLVWKVVQNTPSQKCGLEAGDIITHVNGIAAKETADIYTISGKEKSVKVRIIRGGKVNEILLKYSSK